jgi:DNA-binding NarL/FixJ family response regulator
VSECGAEPYFTILTRRPFQPFPPAPSPNSPNQNHPISFSTEDVQVLDLLRDGLDVREIASALAISDQEVVGRLQQMAQMLLASGSDSPVADSPAQH